MAENTRRRGRSGYWLFVVGMAIVIFSTAITVAGFDYRAGAIPQSPVGIAIRAMVYVVIITAGIAPVSVIVGSYFENRGVISLNRLGDTLWKIPGFDPLVITIGLLFLAVGTTYSDYLMGEVPAVSEELVQQLMWNSVHVVFIPVAMMALTMLFYTTREAYEPATSDGGVT